MSQSAEPTQREAHLQPTMAAKHPPPPLLLRTPLFAAAVLCHLLVLGLVIPRIWSRYLEATKELDAGGGPYVARVTRDERGVYKRLKRAWRDIT